MKIIFAIIFILTSHLAEARTADISKLSYAQSFGKCLQFFPGDDAVARKMLDSQYELCNAGYAVLYDGQKKIPKITFTTISRADVDKARTLDRTDIEFIPDPRLRSNHRAQNTDYARSGYDRGHQFASANSGSELIMEESNLLSNIAPEQPHLNREVKVQAERAIRAYARRVGNPIFVAVGTHVAGDTCDRYIGNQVCVPDHLFLAVYDPKTKKSWAYWFSNSETEHMKAPITLEELEEKIGYRFWSR